MEAKKDKLPIAEEALDQVSGGGDGTNYFRPNGIGMPEPRSLGGQGELTSNVELGGYVYPSGQIYRNGAGQGELTSNIAPPGTPVFPQGMTMGDGASGRHQG